MSSFVELHARSAFSFHRGVSHPEDLVERAHELGLSGLAVTDRDGVYGAARANVRARELAGGFRAWVGAEVSLEGGSVLPVLAATRAGYGNLCQLLTRAKLRAEKGAGTVLWEELEEFREGLHVLTGDEEGPLRRCLGTAGTGVAAAAEVLGRLVRIYGSGQVWVEVQRHCLRGERLTGRILSDLAGAHGLRIVASNGPCASDPEGRKMLDAFTCLRNHTRLDQAGVLLARNAERYLKGGREMAELFSDQPEALRNTLELADRLEFTLEDLGYQFPRYPTAPGESEDSVLRREAYAGARRRYGKITPAVKRQIEHELDLIRRLGFSGYFLIVWQITEFAREQGILAQGRGSAANSAVCYSLGITNVDPVGGNLLFERFLSEGRTSWPDIDIDLPSGDRREAVIQEVFRRYQPRGAAMTANVITYRTKSAMREMGKVLDLPEDVLGRFSDLGGQGDYPETTELRERLEMAGLPGRHPRIGIAMELCRRAIGLPRHLGQHSGGMIISDRPLDTVVPLERASMPGRVVVQWDKDDCADLGIVKVDLLGLGMLSAVQDTLRMCSDRGRPVDLARLPKDDPAVFDMLCRADTIGLFQVESRAQMATLPRMQPKVFYDIVIETALIRPGPIVGKMVHPYLNRRNGREAVDCIDDRFKPALERTLGVPLFQEQVLRMAMVIADFTGSEAEELRRAMSFHRSPERMNRVMGKLRGAMTEKGVDGGLQERIVTAIQSFALYGFPESHAISFALIAYASAWLKVHRMAEFYAGLINNQPMGFYATATLLQDAKRHGIRVCPVCVVHSGEGCEVVSDREIRLGLCDLKGLARMTAQRIVRCRAEAPFLTLADFLQRTRVARDERRILAQSGALNALPGGGNRRAALWRAEQPPGEDDLFAHLDAPADRLPLMTPIERLQADYETQHLTTGPHPMFYLRESLADLWRAADLPQATDGAHIVVGGLVICRQRPGTAKGHVFLSLEDETGIANIFVPAPTFERFRLVITQEAFLRIQGRVQSQDGVISVYALHLEALAEAPVAEVSSHDFR
ncbi:MAG: error-prone DNA polymerase [Verrucomicrobia bacterium]|nr:error-prone DNA polymerase [Verrucomicrobiota bacterium]